MVFVPFPAGNGTCPASSGCALLCEAAPKGARIREIGRVRTVEIKIRLSVNEHEKLLAKRGKMRLATWVRETCLHGMPPIIPQLNLAALPELQRIGGNLNQIAHRLNSGEAADILKIRSEVHRLRGALLGATE